MNIRPLIWIALGALFVASVLGIYWLGRNDLAAPARLLSPKTEEPHLSQRIIRETSPRINRNTIIPASLRFAGIEKLTSSAENLDELLSSYPASDRAKIENFINRYPTGAFDFKSKEQLAWQVERGYPTPDDILAADRTRTAILKSQSTQGNVKAISFYVDRVLRGAEITTDAEIEITRFIDEALNSGSPFAGHTLARYRNEAKKDAAGTLAAYNWIYMTGDTRAGELLSSIDLNSRTTASEALNFYSALQWQTFANNPSLLDQKKYPRLPPP